jgi:hypothetical protein
MEARTAVDPATIPKVELHCHLDGILDPAMLRALRRRGRPLPLRPEALDALYLVRDYDGFVRYFARTELLEGDIDRFRPVIALHLERLKAQRVVYTEIVVGSSAIPRDRSELVGKRRDFRAFVDRCEDGRVQVEFLVVFSRRAAPERVEDLVDRVLPVHEAGWWRAWPSPVPSAAIPSARWRVPSRACTRRACRSRSTRASGRGPSRCRTRSITADRAGSATASPSSGIRAWARGCGRRASTSRCAPPATCGRAPWRASPSTRSAAPWRRA